MEVSIEALRFVFPEDLLAHFDLTQAKALRSKVGHEVLEVEFTFLGKFTKRGSLHLDPNIE